MKKTEARFTDHTEARASGANAKQKGVVMFLRPDAEAHTDPTRVIGRLTTCDSDEHPYLRGYEVVVVAGRVVKEGFLGDSSHRAGFRWACFRGHPRKRRARPCRSRVPSVCPASGPPARERCGRRTGNEESLVDDPPVLLQLDARRRTLCCEKNFV
jgi:hypothetical protein